MEWENDTEVLGLPDCACQCRLGLLLPMQPRLTALASLNGKQCAHVWGATGSCQRSLTCGGMPRHLQVHAAHEKGMGSKAMLLLAGLAREAELLHVLRSMLQPRDYACLVAISRRAVSAASHSVTGSSPAQFHNRCYAFHWGIPRWMMG